MADSAPSSAVIELGKKFVAEVGIDERDRDSLGRWLAHDIARKIDDAERLQGSEGEAAREACSVAILRLWEHRAVWPRGQRPFAAAEGALKLLESLDISKASNRYFQEPKRRNPSDGWLETASAIDRAARVLLRACARLAAEDKDGRASAYIKIAEKAGLDGDVDTAFIRILTMSEKKDTTAEQAAKERAKELEALKLFAKASKLIRAAIEAQAAASDDDVAVDGDRLE